MGTFRAFGATLFLCLAAASGHVANASSSAFMTIGEATSAPIGHKMFCLDHDSECRPPAGDAKEIEPAKLNETLTLAVSAINMAVNGSIKAESDQDLYGVEEKWTYPSVAGDCEDYALLKRRVIAETTGISLGDLLMTVVRKRNGEGHAVLTLVTTQGDFILDNLDWRILPFSQTPYTFVKRQNSHDPGAWNKIETAAPTAVVAAVGP